MPNWFDAIAESTRKHDAQPQTLEVGDARLLVTVHGARLLACDFPKVRGLDTNLFWSHPSLLTPESSDAAFAEGPIGGDRLWIAPEVGFIFFDLKNARRDPITFGKTPTAMDPGDWRIIEQSQNHLRLQTEMTLTDHRLKKDITFRAARQFDSVGRPDGIPKRLRWAGVAIRNELTLLESQTGTMAGAWDLLQLPPTGWLICPTVGEVKKVNSFYDSFGPKHVKIDKTSVRFLIDGKRRVKMGVPPHQTTGRMGYYRKLPGGKLSSLIVRMFGPQPGEPYIDLPRSSNAFFGGDAVQAYNDDGRFGGFGEMEHHDPALVAGQEPAVRNGSCVTHVFVGSDADVKAAGRVLLGVRV